MSQENVEIIARLYENFLARPERLMSPEILEFFDPAVEIRQSASVSEPRERSTGTRGWRSPPAR
jgi:hypothetical protein